MIPLLQKIQTKTSLLALILALGSALGIVAWCPQLFNTVYSRDSYLLTHSLLELSNIVLCLSIFLTVWFSWKYTANACSLCISATFLAVSLLEIAHTFSVDGMPVFFTANTDTKAYTYCFFAKLLTSAGLLGASLIHSQKKPPWFQQIRFSAIALAISLWLIAIPLICPDISQILIYNLGQPHTKSLISYAAVVISGLSIYILGRGNPTRRHIFFLQAALAANLLGELTFLLFSNGFDTFNLLGHLYKLCTAYFVLRSIFEISVIHPYKRVTRLAGALRTVAIRNIASYKEAKASNLLLQQTFVQLGATLASKNNLEQMLQKILQATATVFQCDHAYLALVEGTPSTLRIVAYLSSFKPPDRLAPDCSYMGEILTQQQSLIIGDISACSDNITADLRAAGLRSMIGTPIRHNGDILGVLGLFSRKNSRFSADDAAFLTVFARHAGEAIKNARFFENTVQSFNNLQLVYDIVKDIATQLSPVNLLYQVTEKLYPLFKADGAASFIMHYRSDGVHAEPVYIGDFSPTEISHLQRIFSDSEIAWPWAALSNMGQNEPYHPQSLITMSILTNRRLDILPLLAGGQLQGLIVFSWNDPKAEIPSDLEMILGTIAGQTAIGLERAYLYENCKKQALTDALTKLPNRRQFDISLSREISRSVKYSRPVSLVMLDIDFFKKVNDTWGHLAGDHILQQLGMIIREQFRSTDIPARYGGEEFAVILPETEINDACVLAEKFRQYVAQNNFIVDNNNISITVSLGIATLSGSECSLSTAEQLVEAADQALYQAKQSGRNCIVTHKTKPDTKSHEVFELN